MNKEQALEKVKVLEEELNKLRTIIDKPEVKPLFPRSCEEGARFMVDNFGNVAELYEHSHNLLVENLATQGRTFYTREEAEAFAKRERAKVYCLERINEVNEGDNGYKYGSINYLISFNHHTEIVDFGEFINIQPQESNEYIRTEKAAEQLINDPEFVEQWKIWKGVE